MNTKENGGLPLHMMKWGALANERRAQDLWNSSWSLWNADGKARHIRPYEPCFSGLYYWGNLRVFEAEYFVTCSYFPPEGASISRQDALNYIGFLTDPARSPWKGVLDHLVVSDPEWIGEHGYVFKDMATINRKLFYSFLMATRKPWEISEVLHTAIVLQTKGFSERESHFLSHVWCPWNDGFVIYAPGHTFLADGERKSGAYRFINQCPRMEKGGEVVPSDPIWYTWHDPSSAMYALPYRDGRNVKKYMLEELRNILAEWLEAQEKAYWEEEEENLSHSLVVSG